MTVEVYPSSATDCESPRCLAPRGFTIDEEAMRALMQWGSAML